ncbi:MAG: formylglycine-generating enzyme family protein, partial [Polyangiaceae bacterium]
MVRVVLAGVVGVLAVTGPSTAATATLTSTSTSTPTPTATPTSTLTSTCPSTAVWIPPTDPSGFRMGKGTRGAHDVVITHGFCMDAAEVSVRQFSACVADGACKEPWKADPYSMYPARLDYPVNLVSWPKAQAYCVWAGGRLPTEAEWEWAATGPEQSKYPWGDAPDPSCDYVDYTKLGAPKWAAGADVGCGGGGPSPVGAHPKGDRIWPGGAIHDLAGNVWEWTEDSFAPYTSATQTDPVVRTAERVHV